MWQWLYNIYNRLYSMLYTASCLELYQALYSRVICQLHGITNHSRHRPPSLNVIVFLLVTRPGSGLPTAALVLNASFRLLFWTKARSHWFLSNLGGDVWQSNKQASSDARQRLPASQAIAVAAGINQTKGDIEAFLVCTGGGMLSLVNTHDNNLPSLLSHMIL